MIFSPLPLILIVWFAIALLIVVLILNSKKDDQ